MPGFNVHGERVIDGASNVLTALTLYEAGSTTTRSLKAKEVLHITDVIIMTEEAFDVELVADSAAGGRYLVNTKSAGGIPIVINYNSPYICPKGVVPKFKGADSKRNMCVIQGFIREG